MNRAGAGFTLIEVLVAMTITAISATVILAYVRSLMQRAEREQAHQLAVLRLMNDGQRLVHGGGSASDEPRLEGDKLLIAPLNPVPGSPPPVQVHNFSLRSEPLPAVGLAYTPFQLYSVAREGYTLHRLGPGLPPPPGAAQISIESISPDMLQPSAAPKPVPAAAPVVAPVAAPAAAPRKP